MIVVGRQALGSKRGLSTEKDVKENKQDQVERAWERKVKTAC